MAASTKKYYVTVGGEYLVALETETGQLLGRNRDLNELHGHVQSIFPGSVYVPLDDERVQQYVATHGVSRTPNVAPSSSNQTYQAPLPVVIVQPPGQSGWFRRNLPHILAITGGLFFLLFMLLPLKAYSVDNLGSNGLGTIRLSQSGYGALQTPGGLFILLAVVNAVIKVMQMVRGGVPTQRERNFTSYAAIAALAIVGVLVMYWGVHLYDATTGKIMPGIYEAPKGPYLTIPSLLIVLIGGIIEVRRYRRGDAALAGAVASVGTEKSTNMGRNAQPSARVQPQRGQGSRGISPAKARTAPQQPNSSSEKTFPALQLAQERAAQLRAEQKKRKEISRVNLQQPPKQKESLGNTESPVKELPKPPSPFDSVVDAAMRSVNEMMEKRKNDAER